MKSLEYLFANSNVGNIRAQRMGVAGKIGMVIVSDLDKPMINTKDPMLAAVVGSLGSDGASCVMEINRNTIFPAPPNTAEMMCFSQAFAAIRAGYPVTRSAWELKPRHIALSIVEERDPTGNVLPRLNTNLTCIELKQTGTAFPTVTMSWLPTTEDLFAEDWEIVTVDYLTSKYNEFLGE